MAREITISDLKSKVDEGWKKIALADHYGLPMAQMTRLLQEAGLKIRKFHAPLYTLVDDTTTVVENTSVTAQESQDMSVGQEVDIIPVITPEHQTIPIQEEEQVLETVDSAVANQTW